MKCLYVLFDGRCSFCCRCADWLREQPGYVRLDCMARQSLAARQRFAALLERAGEDDLLVVADDGAVYRNTSAYLMCLWALKEYRPWARRLATPMLKPMVREFFKMTSRHRGTLSAWWGEASDKELGARLACETVVCETPMARRENNGAGVLRELLEHP